MYEMTILNRSEVNFDLTPNSDLKNELLKNYYNIFINSDINNFFEQLASLKSILTNNIFNKKLNYLMQILSSSDIEILKDIYDEKPRTLFINSIDEIILNKNNPIFIDLCKLFLINFKSKIDNFREVYERYIQSIKTDRNYLYSFFSNLENVYNKILNSLIKRIDYKLYEYFNSSVLSWFVLNDYYGISDIDDNLLKDVHGAYIIAIKPIEVRKIFKDTPTNFQYIYNEILDYRKKLEEHLNIVRLNIETIYTIDKSSSKLNVGPAFITSKTFFYTDENAIKAFKSSQQPRRGNRRQAATQTRDTSVSIQRIENLKLKNWYINSKAYNQIYKIITNDKDKFNLLKEDFNLTKEKIEKIYYSIFKHTSENTFLKPKNDFNTNQRGEYKSNDINSFFENTGFILMIAYILKETLNKYTSVIKNITDIIDPTKNFKINNFLTMENNYYNNDKYKLITIIGSYTKHMLLKKWEYINSSKKSYNIYRFDKLFRTELFPNPKQQIDGICNMLDTLMIFTKSKYIKNVINDIDDEQDIDESVMNKYWQSLDTHKLLSETEIIIKTSDKYISDSDKLSKNKKRGRENSKKIIEKIEQTFSNISEKSDSLSSPIQMIKRLTLNPSALPFIPKLPTSTALPSRKGRQSKSQKQPLPLPLPSPTPLPSPPQQLPQPLPSGRGQPTKSQKQAQPQPLPSGRGQPTKSQKQQLPLPSSLPQPQIRLTRGRNIPPINYKSFSESGQKQKQ
jgi:hypothetical protein